MKRPCSGIGFLGTRYGLGYIVTVKELVYVGPDWDSDTVSSVYTEGVCRKGWCRVDFLGIGVLELLAILLIAVIVLGPAGTVKGARSIGRMLGEVRRSMTDLSNAVEAEEREMERSVNHPEPVDRRGPEGPEQPR